MKPEELTPRAREAFGRTLIDVGVAIFKGIILLFTVVPITLILKSALEPGSSNVSIIALFENMSMVTYLSLIGFLVISFYAGHVFRKEGLRHIQEVELNET